MSHSGDSSKPSAGKSFGHHVWQLALPFPPPSFPTGVEMFVGFGPKHRPYITWLQAYNKSLAPDTYTAFTHHSFL